jgi:hypothetical protein
MKEPFYVYVAGPLSDMPAQYLANVSRLSHLSRALTEYGYVTINPAADMLEGLMGMEAWPLERYQQRSLNLLRLLIGRRGCLYVDAVIHADGRDSSGVNREIEFALQNGIPVVDSLLSLAAWRARATTPADLELAP